VRVANTVDPVQWHPLNRFWCVCEMRGGYRGDYSVVVGERQWLVLGSEVWAGHHLHRRVHLVAPAHSQQTPVYRDVLRCFCSTPSLTGGSLMPSGADVARAAALLLLLTLCHRQLTDVLAGEVALGPWSVCLHSRTVVRLGCVLLGGIATDLLTALGL
jgi:hypothetical protein